MLTKQLSSHYAKALAKRALAINWHDPEDGSPQVKVDRLIEACMQSHSLSLEYPRSNIELSKKIIRNTLNDRGSFEPESTMYQRRCKIRKGKDIAKPKLMT